MGIEGERERSARAARGSKLSLTKLRSWPSCATTTAEQNSQLLSLVLMLPDLLLHRREVRDDMFAASSSPSLNNRKAQHAFQV